MKPGRAGGDGEREARQARCLDGGVTGPSLWALGGDLLSYTQELGMWNGASEWGTDPSGTGRLLGARERSIRTLT